MNDKVKSPGRRKLVTGLTIAGVVAAFAGTSFIPSLVNAAGEGDISDQVAFERQQAGEMLIVDVRTPLEWQQTGIAEGAIKADMQDPDFLNKMVALRQSNPDKEIGFICRSSNRSGQVQKALSQAGFDRVYSVFGGMSGNGQVPGWIADGLPVEKCC